jgi:5'(3')-deoxyribonucleotidase
LKKNPSQPYPQSKWGFFLDLEPIEGAIDAIDILKKDYDVWILTRPSMRNINSYTEKAYWVNKYLGYDMLEKTIYSPDKSLLIGDYLIDDQNNAKQEEFKGKWLHYGSDKFKNWNDIISYFI